MFFNPFLFVFAMAVSFSGTPAVADDLLWGKDSRNDMVALPVTLKANGTVSAGHIVLGDIFSGLDSTQHNRQIAKAPACNQDVVLDAVWLNAVAQKQELSWTAKNTDRLVLTRVCDEITHDEILKAFTESLKRQHLPTDAEIVLNQKNVSFIVSKESNPSVDIRESAYHPDTATVTGTAVLTENGVITDKKPLFGKVVLFIHTPVASRPLAKGEIITKNDIVIQKVPLDETYPRKPTASEDLIGKEVRRPIRAGQAVDRDDVRAQIVIEKGKTVDVHYTKGGLSLKAQAKALENGAVGDVIRVQNQQSKTTLQGVVIDADTVSVTDDKKGEKQ